MNVYLLVTPWLVSDSVQCLPGAPDDSDTVCSDDRGAISANTGVVTLITCVMQTFVSPGISANHSPVFAEDDQSETSTVALTSW